MCKRKIMEPTSLPQTWWRQTCYWCTTLLMTEMELYGFVIWLHPQARWWTPPRERSHSLSTLLKKEIGYGPIARLLLHMHALLNYFIDFAQIQRTPSVCEWSNEDRQWFGLVVLTFVEILVLDSWQQCARYYWKALWNGVCSKSIWCSSDQ